MDTLPYQIRFIVGNEACERFSFYGMRSILTIFMVQYLAFTETKATVTFHLFVALSYFLPFFGAYLADRIWGKYKTILYLSFAYCIGHLVLAVWENVYGFYIGLAFVAIGAGGIKPCVSAHVGDQFSKKNQHLLKKVFALFYWSINFGSFFSILLIPLALKYSGPGLAFGIPGILMLAATFVFWLGRKHYVHVPPERAKKSFQWRELTGIAKIFAALCLFWSLYDQHSSTWVLQAQNMQNLIQIWGLSFEILPAQMQILNPIFILTLVPAFTYIIYPLLDKLGFRPSDLQKMGAGLLLAALSFIPISLFEFQIVQGDHISILWQVFPYLMITTAEILVSVTALEFAYTQASPALKSTIMSIWLLTFSIGNLITAGVEQLTQSLGLLGTAGTFSLWVVLGFLFFGIYLWVARNYKMKNHVLDA